MEQRFRALRVIATILKVLAWLVLVFGVLIGIVVFFASVAGGQLLGGYGAPGAAGVLGGFFGGAMVMVIAVIYFLLLYAWAEFIYLLLAIEENTRATTQLLQRQVSPPSA